MTLVLARHGDLLARTAAASRRERAAPILSRFRRVSAEIGRWKAFRCAASSCRARSSRSSISGEGAARPSPLARTFAVGLCALSSRSAEVSVIGASPAPRLTGRRSLPRMDRRELQPNRSAKEVQQRRMRPYPRHLPRGARQRSERASPRSRRLAVCGPVEVDSLSPLPARGGGLPAGVRQRKDRPREQPAGPLTPALPAGGQGRGSCQNRTRSQTDHSPDDHRDHTDHRGPLPHRTGRRIDRT